MLNDTMMEPAWSLSLLSDLNRLRPITSRELYQLS